MKLPNKGQLKLIAITFLIITISLFTLNPVAAKSISKSGNTITIASNETLNQTTFLSGNQIRIDGDINATSFLAASNVEINGDIKGDVFIAAQNITINGTIDGSVFTASQNVSVNGLIENNLYSAGAAINLNAQTHGSTFLAGQTITFKEDNLIKHDSFIGADEVYYAGLIEGDLTSSSKKLEVSGQIKLMVI